MSGWAKGVNEVSEWNGSFKWVSKVRCAMWVSTEFEGRKEVKESERMANVPISIPIIVPSRTVIVITILDISRAPALSTHKTTHYVRTKEGIVCDVPNTCATGHASTIQKSGLRMAWHSTPKHSHETKFAEHVERKRTETNREKKRLYKGAKHSYLVNRRDHGYDCCRSTHSYTGNLQLL